jgi:hypothetical protein
MTRRRKLGSGTKKAAGGVLVGMREGTQRVAGAVAGTGADDEADDAAPQTKTKSRASKIWSFLGNIVSILLLIAAGAVLLKRCGILKFH